MKFVSIHLLLLISLISLTKPVPASDRPWSLEACLDSAAVHNKSLQLKTNERLLAHEKYREARSGLIPKIQVGADYRYYLALPYQFLPLSVFGGPEEQFKEAQFGVPHNLNAQVQVAVPIYQAQAFGALEATQIAYEIKELEYYKTEEALFYDIVNLFYNAQIMLQQMAFLDSNLTNAERLLSNTRLLQENQLARESDVQKIRLLKDQLQTERLRLESQHSQVLNLLKFHMGQPATLSLELDPVIRYSGPVDYVPVPSLDSRIIDARKRLLANELKTLKNSRWPALSAYGSYGAMGFGYDERPNGFLKFHQVGSVGLQLSYPLFDGTLTRRKINGKEIEMAGNALQAGLEKDRQAMMIENALLQRASTLSSIATRSAQVDLAQLIFNQALLQQKQGIAALPEVLTAENELRDSQKNYLLAVVEYLRSDLELKKLTGQLLTR